METSEALPPGAVEAPDLADLARRPGPFLLVRLGTPSAVENERWQTDLLAEGTARTAEALSRAQPRSRSSLVTRIGRPSASAQIPWRWRPTPPPSWRWASTSPTHVRRTDAFIRAALATSAGVVRVMNTPDRYCDGVGALLRWSAAPS